MAGDGMVWHRSSVWTMIAADKGMTVWGDSVIWDMLQALRVVCSIVAAASLALDQPSTSPRPVLPSTCQPCPCSQGWLTQQNHGLRDERGRAVTHFN